jgi:hypothetical protein
MAISLDEVRSRRTDSEDQVGALFCIDRMKVIDEWTV